MIIIKNIDFIQTPEASTYSISDFPNAEITEETIHYMQEVVYTSSLTHNDKSYTFGFSSQALKALDDVSVISGLFKHRNDQLKEAVGTLRQDKFLLENKHFDLQESITNMSIWSRLKFIFTGTINKLKR